MCYSPWGSRVGHNWATELELVACTIYTEIAGFSYYGRQRLGFLFSFFCLFMSLGFCLFFMSNKRKCVSEEYSFLPLLPWSLAQELLPSATSQQSLTYHLLWVRSWTRRGRDSDVTSEMPALIWASFGSQTHFTVTCQVTSLGCAAFISNLTTPPTPCLCQLSSF